MMADPISLIVPDAGPLISLAMADRLDLLDEFLVPIATLDVVKAECLYRDWPGRPRLERWFGTNSDRLEIISSPIMPLYLKGMGAESSSDLPIATRGLGDASIAWFVANVSAIRRQRTTTLVLTRTLLSEMEHWGATFISCRRAPSFKHWRSLMSSLRRKTSLMTLRGWDGRSRHTPLTGLL